MKKRFLSLLLTMCMVLVLMPMTVRATVTEHKHCICGASHTNIGDHGTESVQNFEAWSSADSLPTEGKSYYLTTNVTLSATWTPADGTVLCLNGHTIEGDIYNLIVVDQDVNFILTDCASSDSPGKIVSQGSQGAVVIKKRGTFTMYGGSISDGNVTYGGMVEVRGTFTMNGGSISNNKRENAGEYIVSGVYVDDGGKFTMNSGSISDNIFASDSGGVYVELGGTFNMNSGSITGNKAVSQGIYGDGGGVYNRGTFNMSGGKITGNTASENGGGVYNDGNLTVSGGVTIMSNTAGTNDNNLLLLADKKIEISGALTEGTSIGVTVSNPPTDGSSVDITSGGASDYSSYFFSDNSNYEIYDENNTLKLREKTEKITSVNVTIAIPTPKDTLARMANVSDTGVATTNPTIVWKKGSEVVGGIVRYNTAYTASVTLSPNAGYEFDSAVTANIKSADDSTVGSGTVTDNGDGTITVSYTFAATQKANVTRISNLRDITGVANGTQKTAQALGLPETVTIGTEDENRAANVIWDLENLAEGTYEPSVLTEQSFKVNGTVILPDDIGNGNNLELQVTVQVTVSAAGVVGVPQATPAEGTYTSNQSVVLSSSTEGAEIYYTTDGSDPSRTSTKYTGAIRVTGTAGQTVQTTIKAIAVKSGMQDSNVAIFTYTIQDAGSSNPGTGDSVDLEELTFGYAYDAQKEMVYPQGIGSIMDFSDLDKPLLENGSRKDDYAGNWTLTKAGTYSYLKNYLEKNNKDTSNLESVVSAVIQEYGWSEEQKNKSVIYELKDGENHIAYGVIIAYDTEKERAVFVGDNLSGGYGYLLTKRELRVSPGVLGYEVTVTKTARDFVFESEYQMLEGMNGEWTQDSDGTLSFRADGAFDKFIGVMVDNSLLDTQNYTAESGSTIVTLKGDYLRTLSVGLHWMTVVYNDGECVATFKIQEAADNSDDEPADNPVPGNSDDEPADNPASGDSDDGSTEKNAPENGIDKKDDVPKTGDSTPMVWLFVLAGFSGTGLFLTGKKDRKTLKILGK